MADFDWLGVWLGRGCRYNEIVEMLLSAGYFRARIAALSEFDKVRRNSLELVVRFCVLPHGLHSWIRGVLFW